MSFCMQIKPKKQNKKKPGEKRTKKLLEGLSIRSTSIVGESGLSILPYSDSIT